MNNHVGFGWICLFLLFGAAVPPGCSNLGNRGATEYTDQDLRNDLAQFAARFPSIVSAAADDIDTATDSRVVRRSTLIWKMRMVPLVQETGFGDDPREAYVETLGLTVVMRQYLTEGAGREIFGEHQSIAVGAARELETEALAIGQQFLDPEQMDRLTAQLDELARENPIRGRDFSIETVQAGLAKIETSEMFGWIVSIPMSPFRALEGVGSTAHALHKINNTANELAELVGELPRQTRWQVELLLYDIENRDTVMGGLSAFEQVAASADRLSRSVERLPEDLRGVLKDLQTPLVEANQAILNAQKLIEPVPAILKEVGEITGELAALKGEKNSDALAARPFDIQEYENTLDSAATAVHELRGLVTDVRELLDSGKLDRIVVDTVQRTEEEISHLVNRVGIIVALLLVAFFSLLLMARWISARMRRGQSEASPSQP